MMTRFYVICTSKKKEKLITSHSLHNRIHLEQKTKNGAKNKIISSYPILEQLDQQQGRRRWVGRVGNCPQILADHLILYQPEGADWAPRIITCPPSLRYLSSYVPEQPQLCIHTRHTCEPVDILRMLSVITGVRSCVSSPFSRCTPVLDWSG